MILKTQELKMIEGGAFSATMLNAIIKGFENIFSLGRTLGSALSRIISGSRC